MIGIEGLEVRYGEGGGRGRLLGRRRPEVWALRGLSLAVGAGESVALVGPSGAGKSSVLRAFCGLAPVAAGRLRLDGEPLRSPRGRNFHRRVRMVFQDPYASLHPRHTVDRTLSEPLAIHGLGSRDMRVRRALDEVGLDAGLRYRLPRQLSGGQRQRVALARALIVEPDAVLLDEPTSALDASARDAVLALLGRLRAERGLTCLLVSHDPSVAARLCERQLSVRHGVAVEVPLGAAGQ